MNVLAVYRCTRCVCWLCTGVPGVCVGCVQAYLVLSGFYRSYGGLALLLCPLRTWAILLAICLRRRALAAGSQSPVSAAGTQQQLQSTSLDSSGSPAANSHANDAR